MKRGETLFAIAWRTGKDPKDIAAYNAIKAPYTIFPGQKLRLTPPKYVIPGSGTKKKQGNIQAKKQPTTTDKTSKHNEQKKLEQAKRKEYAEKANNKKGKTDALYPNQITKWQWPARGKIIQGFSSSEQGNKGIDIAGERKQSVYAAAEGKVVYAGSALRGYGRLIIVKHNDDYLSAYAHNDKLLVKEQQTVKVGQKIAEMGSTGTSDVRLHFEIRYRGKSVDPMRYLPRR